MERHVACSYCRNSYLWRGHQSSPERISITNSPIDCCPCPGLDELQRGRVIRGRRKGVVRSLADGFALLIEDLERCSEGGKSRVCLCLRVEVYAFEQSALDNFRKCHLTAETQCRREVAQLSVLLQTCQNIRIWARPSQPTSPRLSRHPRGY